MIFANRRFGIFDIPRDSYKGLWGIRTPMTERSAILTRAVEHCAALRSR